MTSFPPADDQYNLQCSNVPVYVLSDPYYDHHVSVKAFWSWSIKSTAFPITKVIGSSWKAWRTCEGASRFQLQLTWPEVISYCRLEVLAAGE